MRKLFFFLGTLLSMMVYSQTPTTSASNITFTSVGCNEFTATWTNGNGMERVVIVREAADLTQVPEKDQFYNFNTKFGLGESIYKDGIHYCVYRGIGNSVRVTGLKKVTKYYVGVFEYNTQPPKYDYMTSSFPKNSVTTVSINAGFTLQPNSQCLNGNSVQFTNTSVSDRSPLSYKWDFGDGKSSTATDPSHSYSSFGVFKVRCIAMAPGCVDTTYLLDTINPHPVPYFDLDPAKINNDSVQCFYRNRYTFRNTTTLASFGGGFSSTRYEWSYKGNIFHTGHKADHHFDHPGIYTVKLVAISNKGCKDSISKTYEVLPRAIDSTKVIFNPREMCLTNNKFNFINNSPLSVSSRWHFGESTKDSMDGATANHSYSKIGKYLITLEAYDARGCLDVFKDSVSVISNTNVSFTGLKKFYCINEPKSFLIPNPGNGSFFGTGVNAMDSSFFPSTLGTSKVGYVYTKGGCKDTVWDSTMVYDRPALNLGKDTTICSDSPIQLNVDPSYSSVWSPGNQSGSSISVNTTGRYIVTSKLGNCDASDTINVKSISAPQLFKMGDTTLCGGSYLKFNLKVEDGTATWNDGNTNRDRVLTQSGFYRVVLANKCGMASDSFTLNIEETACVIFFPNAFTPNGDFLNDTWQPFGKYEFVRMNIFNRWGEQVYESSTSPVWDGYYGNDICLDGVYNIVFQYLIQDGNTFKKMTKGVVVHLIR